MTTEEKIAMFEQSRERMHRAIDEKIDDIIKCLCTGQSIRQNGVRHYDLSEPPFLFKGKKPVSITYPNGEKVFVNTWRKVAGELLNDCNSYPQRHEALMQLRHKIAGRNRWVLADTPTEASEMFHILKNAENPHFYGFRLHTFRTTDKVVRYGINNQFDFAEHPAVIQRGEKRTINICVAVPDVA